MESQASLIIVYKYFILSISEFQFRINVKNIIKFSTSIWGIRIVPIQCDYIWHNAYMEFDKYRGLLSCIYQIYKYTNKIATWSIVEFCQEFHFHTNYTQLRKAIKFDFPHKFLFTNSMILPIITNNCVRWVVEGLIWGSPLQWSKYYLV